MNELQKQTSMEKESLDDYLYAPKLHEEMVHTAYYRDELKITEYENNIIIASYSGCNIDMSSSYLKRRDIYENGVLAVRENYRDNAAKKINNITIFKKSNFTELYLEAADKMFPPYSISYDYSEKDNSNRSEIIFPGIKKIIDDFKTMYQYNTANKFNDMQFSFKYPDEEDIMLNLGETGTYTVTANDVRSAIIDAYLNEAPGNKSEIGYINPDSLLHNTVESLRFSLQKSVADTFNNWQDLKIMPDAVKKLINIAIKVEAEDIMALSKDICKRIYELQLSNDVFKLNKIKILCDGIIPITNDRPILNKINYQLTMSKGYFKIGHDANNDLLTPRGLQNIADDINRTINEIHTIRQRVFVSNIPDEKAEEKELSIIVDADYTSTHYQQKDLIHDYRYLDEFLLSLKDIAAKSREISNANNCYEIVRDYTKVFAKAKLELKTTFFKEPCNQFCAAVKKAMNNDHTLKELIISGKEPNNVAMCK